MPNTIYTPEEIASLNAAGHAAGMRSCPVCGDSIRWKPFHETIYYSGPLEFENGTRGNGSLGVTAICEDCWQTLDPSQRLPFVLAVVDSWEKALPTPKKIPAGKGLSTFVDDPADVERCRLLREQWEKTKVAVEAAVKDGK